MHHTLLRPTPSAAAQARAAGLTLPELLVVVGVVAALAAVLLPSVAAARQEARRVHCLANLRQMVVAAHAYAADDDAAGRYPVAYYDADDGAAASYSYAWDLTTILRPGRPPEVVPGLLWRGEPGGDSAAARVQQCPSFDGAANWLADPYTGYNYNTSYIGHGQYESNPAPARVADVRRPAETALFGDGQYAGGADKFMRAPWPNSGDASFAGRWAGTQGYRHRGGRTNVAFCDGHAESRGDRFTANQDGAANVAAGTGFLSADNRAYGGD